jgi:hypothetical protein
MAIMLIEDEDDKIYEATIQQQYKQCLSGTMQQDQQYLRGTMQEMNKENARTSLACLAMLARSAVFPHPPSAAEKVHVVIIRKTIKTL